MRLVDYVWWNGEVEWYALYCCMPAGGGLINMLHMSRADLWQGCHLLFHSSKSVYTHTHHFSLQTEGNSRPIHAPEQVFQELKESGR